MSEHDARHGTNPGYIAGCRNECCRVAHTAYKAALRSRQYLNRGPLMRDGTGTRRRIRALVALGWTLTELDLRIGRRRSYCKSLISGTRMVTPAVAAMIEALYAELSMRVPPASTPDEQRNINRSRTLARRNGWLAPLAWDDIDNDPEILREKAIGDTTIYKEKVCQFDHAVVHRILAGDMTLAAVATRAERQAVVDGWGRSLAELRRLTGWKPERYGRPDAVA